MVRFPYLFFNDTATSEIYPLSLHDALPISAGREDMRSPFAGSRAPRPRSSAARASCATPARSPTRRSSRSEEHTSELQSRENLVCRLLLEKKKHAELEVTAIGGEVVGGIQC